MGKAAEPSQPPGNENQPQSATKPGHEDRQVKMWFVQFHRDPGLYGDPDPDRVPESEAQVDARPWLLRTANIHFAPGDEAFFNLRFRVLMVRASPATIALIDKHSRTAWRLEALERTIRVEASLVEFSAPETPALDGKTSIESLRKAAGDSWRVLNRIQVVTNGNRGGAASKTGVPDELPVPHPPGKDQSTTNDPLLTLLPGEFGAILDTEPSFGSQTEEIIDVNLYYQFRAPGPPVLNWTTTTSISVKVGIPMLLKLDTVAAEGDRSHLEKLRALILKVDIERYGDLTPHPEANLHPPAVSPTPK